MSEQANDLEVIQPTREPVSISKHGLEPTSLDGLWRLAEMVAVSGLAPNGLESPAKICIAMAHGLEIGLKPMQAIQKIAVINGRPSIWGDAMIGLVLKSGLLEEFEEYFEGEEGTDSYRAVCKIKRVGLATAVQTYSVKDAIRAGLWGKKGPWTNHPKRMLKMRARAFALRDYFADVLGGMYMAEELQGEQTFEPSRMRVNAGGTDNLRNRVGDLLGKSAAPSPELPENSNHQSGEDFAQDIIEHMENNTKGTAQ